MMDNAFNSFGLDPTKEEEDGRFVTAAPAVPKPSTFVVSSGAKRVPLEDLSRPQRSASPVRPSEPHTSDSYRPTVTVRSGARVIDSGEMQRVEEKADPWQSKPSNLKEGYTTEDLNNDPEAQKKIRDYMVRRMGTQYLDEPWEKIEEDWSDHQRSMLVNEVSTIGEAMWINKASKEDRHLAADNYELWDKRANILSGGDFVDGITDYAEAILTAPSTYVGLVVGGLLGKGGTAAGAAAVKGAARLAAQRAGSEAVKQGVKGAAKQAAMRSAWREFVKSNSRSAAGKFFGGTATRRAISGGAVEATAAVVQDRVLQDDVWVDSGYKKEIDYTQLALSGSLGFLGGAIDQYLAKSAGRAAKPTMTRTVVEGATEKEVTEVISSDALIDAIYNMAAPLKKSERKALQRASATTFKENIQTLLGRNTTFASSVQAAVRDASWQDAVLKGEELVDSLGKPAKFGNVTLSPEEVHLLLREGGENSIAQVMLRSGHMRDPSVRLTDEVTSFLKGMDPQAKQMYEEALNDSLGINLDEFTNVLTYSASQWGKGQKELSEIGKIFSRELADDMLFNALDKVEKGTDPAKLMQKVFGNMDNAQKMQAVQDMYRRALVSSPQTSGLNFLGSAQYFGGDVLADALAAPAMWLAAHAPGVSKEKSKLFSAAARSYRQLTANRIKRFFNALDTVDAFKALIDVDKKPFRAVSAVGMAGVEGATKEGDFVAKYGLEEASKVTRGTLVGMDKIVTTFQKVTGVMVQDIFWKSQFFLGEMDRVAVGAGYESIEALIMKGDYQKVFTTDAKKRVAQETLKGVFSADYGMGAMRRGVTNKSFGGLGNMAADLLENISRTPVLGAAFPFGKFAANMMASFYQWSGIPFIVDALAMVNPASKSGAKPHVKDLTRAVVAWIGVAAAYQIVDENRRQGAPAMSIDTGSGVRVDVSNVFPFSVNMATANLVWEHDNGGIQKRTAQEFARQIAAGEIVEDLNFNGMIDTLLDTASEDGSKKAEIVLGRIAGSFLSGFTRPLQAINEFPAAFVNSSPGVYDRRQAKDFGEAFKMYATRYVDRLWDGMLKNDMRRVVDPMTKQRMASFEKETYLTNPALKVISGVPVVQPLTNFSRVMEMAGLDSSFEANSYTGSPMFDRFANEFVFNEAEARATDLLKDKDFKEGSTLDRKSMVQKMIKIAKAGARESLDGSISTDKKKASLQRILTSARDHKERRVDYHRALKKLNFEETNPLKMSFSQLIRLQQELEGVSNNPYTSIR